MPLRNPFRKALGGLDGDEHTMRDAAARGDQPEASEGAKSGDTREPTEYKLSEINDSGVYLPPSPPESKHSFWQSRSNVSTTSSNHRSVLNESEPFNMSRESFDSYRRSFDISARSPVPSEYSVPTRQSLDSRRALHPHRAAMARPGRHSLDRVDAPPEEGFEDVKLNEDGKPKKKGFLGFGGQTTPKALSEVEKPSMGLHFFPGRKRGQSGGGAELKAMDRPESRSSQVRSVDRQVETSAE